MKQGIYITSAEPGAANRSLSLGPWRYFRDRWAGSVFFRPAVQDEKAPDAITGLIRKRYRLDMPYEMMYGCTYEFVRQMLLDDRDDEILKLVLEKYKALEKVCDMIVCAGSDYTGAAAALEFD